MRTSVLLLVPAVALTTLCSIEGASLGELVEDGGPPIVVGDVAFDRFLGPDDAEIIPFADDPNRPGLLFRRLFYAEEHEGPDPWSIDEFDIISSRRITGLSLELVDYRFYDPQSASLIEVSAHFTDYGVAGVEAELHASATSTLLEGDFEGIDLPPETYLQMLGMEVRLTVADGFPFELRSWAVRAHLVPEPSGALLAAILAIGIGCFRIVRPRWNPPCRNCGTRDRQAALAR